MEGPGVFRGTAAMLLLASLTAAPAALGQDVPVDPGPHPASAPAAVAGTDADGAARALTAAPASTGQGAAAVRTPRLTAFAQRIWGARDASRAQRGKPPARPKTKTIHFGHEEPPTGMLGPHPLTRESSGTSWQPESSIHEGLHYPHGLWTTRVHGWATAVWDNQDGPRGGQDEFGASMLMGATHGPWGPGTIGFRAMLSAEPATIGSEGYPLLLQTGESADGLTPLIDRQHPHDLTMELATMYYLAPDATSSLFVYAGLPGDPALGPPAFMHRFSGESFPEAPISHHWLDATHISYGVVTAGLVDGPWKFEGSMFRGREPDHVRTDIEDPELDSHSFRVSNNPSPTLSVQGSYGRLHSPEALEPDVDVDRTTVSAIVNANGRGRQMQTTVAWGRNHKRPGSELDAFLLEATARMRLRHTWMLRVEQVEKDDLFPPGHARAGTVYQVEKLSAGYRFDFWPRSPLAVGIGGLVSYARVPQELETDYDGNPVSGMAYLRAALR